MAGRVRAQAREFAGMTTFAQLVALVALLALAYFYL